MKIINKNIKQKKFKGLVVLLTERREKKTFLRYE
jgi:hypothetical protein